MNNSKTRAVDRYPTHTPPGNSLLLQAEKTNAFASIHRLESSTSSTTLSSGRVGRRGGDVLDSADSHTGTGEGSESGLATRTGLLGSGSTGGPQLDVEGGDSDFLALGGDVLGGQHGGVRLMLAKGHETRLRQGKRRMEVVGIAGTYRRLVSVSLDLHSTGDSGDGLLAREIGNVHESVVEPGIRRRLDCAYAQGGELHSRGKDVSNAKDVLTLGDLRAEGNSLLLGCSNFLGGLT